MPTMSEVGELPGTQAILANIARVAQEARAHAEAALLMTEGPAPQSGASSSGLDRSGQEVASFDTQRVPTAAMPTTPLSPPPTVPLSATGDRYSPENVQERLVASTDGRSCQNCWRFLSRCQCAGGPQTLESVLAATQPQSQQPPGPLAPADMPPPVEAPAGMPPWVATAPAHVWTAESMMDDQRLMDRPAAPKSAPPELGQTTTPQAKSAGATVRATATRTTGARTARSTSRPPRVSSSASSEQMPEHPAANALWSSPHPFEGGVECSHREHGGCLPYSNQHGAGWRCESCHTKWFRRNNGEQVETSGPHRFRRPGWRAAVAFQGPSSTGQ